MRSPRLSSSAGWTTGIAATLLLAALALQASDFGEPAPRPTAAPDPAVRERILAFEAATGRWSPDLMSFEGPLGRPVYVITAPCCDHFARLYDAEGRFICSPSGGLGGSGDGQCPDWVRDGVRWGRPRLPGQVVAQPY